MSNKTTTIFKIEKATLGMLFKILYNPKFINSEYIPNDGPILVACNHKHLLDQCMTIMSTKRYLRYLAKKEYFDHKIIAWFFKMNGCIPVDRTKKDPKAKEAAIETLKEGGAVGLFPEGTRIRSDKDLLGPFKFGAVSMAQKTDAYIVPCAITGKYKFRSNNLVIRYGKPFKVGKMDLEQANDKLHKEVEKLMKKSLKESNTSIKEELKTHIKK